MSEELRESTTLSWLGKQQTYITHKARGRRTLCGVDLGMAILDPPGYDALGARLCQGRGCREPLQSKRETNA